MEILAPLIRHLPDWVGLFPRRIDDLILPLPIGIRSALAILLPPGDQQALADLDDVLREYIRCSGER